MKKKRKKISRTKYVVTIVALVLFFITLIATLLILNRTTRFLSGDKNRISGNWEMRIETTDYIAGEMARWLSDVSDLKLDEEVKVIRESLEDYDLICELDIDKKTGLYRQSISEESYTKVYEDTYARLSDIIEETIANRMEASGITQTDIGMSVSELVTETIGVSTEEYLKERGPVLLPDIEELRDKYDSDGEYVINGKTITLSGRGDYTFSVNDETLVLTDENGEMVVYGRKE